MHGDAELSAAIHTRGAATQLCRDSGQSCRQPPLVGRLHLAPLSVSCRANPLIRCWQAIHSLPPLLSLRCR